MSKIVAVNLKDKEKKVYCKSTFFGEKKDDLVVVKTEEGLQLGKVCTVIDQENPDNFTNEIINLATPTDLENDEKNKKEEKTALQTVKKTVENLKLNMKILSIKFSLDRSQMMIYFLSDNRIDFRELVKKLASIYHTRIELRQVGVRDKAKEIGGIGCCGRTICCNKFLNDLDSVSINMAKNQGIALNPNKINGLCGRLLCCLKYENETYKCLKKELPKIGTILEDGAKVISVDPLTSSYRFLQKDGTIGKTELKNGCCK